MRVIVRGRGSSGPDSVRVGDRTKYEPSLSTEWWTDLQLVACAEIDAKINPVASSPKGSDPNTTKAYSERLDEDFTNS